jgi:rSAM/selenodomain-associated transferase 2
VVIPVLDEADQVGAAVRQALGQALAGAASGVEVTVVDGGSSDGTPERAAEAGARVLTSGRGRARQLGVGARASRGDVILFLHADTRLPRHYDAAIGDALRDPVVVGGAFRFRFDTDGRDASGRDGAVLRLIEWGARLRGAWLGMPYGDQAMFVRREVLEQIGGVPQAPIMEDLDLVRAMKGRGRLALLPLDALTSPRRYLARGPLRTLGRHWLALLAWWLRVDRARVAAWYGR